MYSQNNEEAVIAAQLVSLGLTGGRFLEIGAFDGVTFSNTFRLVKEEGWSGVAVEASPFVFPKLVANLAAYPQVDLVNAAITANDNWRGLVKWHDSGGDAISTTDECHVAKWVAGSNIRFTAFWINMLPLDKLLAAFGYDYALINIDVESTNLSIFSALPFEKLTATKIICVEHDNAGSFIMEHASTFGFEPVALNAENIILARK